MAIHVTDIPEDESPDKGPGSRMTVKTEVKVDGTVVSWVISYIELNQAAFEHHVLRVTLTADLTSMDLSNQLNETNAYHDIIGKSINLTVTPQEEYVDQAKALEFAGVITDVEVNSRGQNLATVTIEAKSPTIKMDFRNKFVTHKQMSRSDIASQLVQSAGLEMAGVQLSGDASHKPEQFVQWNETDWEFLVSHVSISDSWIYYDGRKLCIGPAATRNQAEIFWGKNVGSIDFKLSAQQLNHKAFGWDREQKAAFTGQQSTATSFSSLAQKAFSGSRTLSSGTSYGMAEADFHQNEVKLHALSDGQEAVAGLLGGTIQCNVPSIKVGDTVKLSDAGSAYNGTYFVEAVRHTVDAKVGYYNVLDVLPLEAAVPTWRGAETYARRMDPFPAVVSNNQDPEKLGRIKLQYYVPEGDSGNMMESDWAPMLMPYAGRERGMYFMPEVDDQVMVIFENGDPTHPVVIGALWNGTDTPRGEMYSDDNDIKIIYTRSGHQLIFDDKSGQEAIKIIDKTGTNSIVIESDKNTITITADKDIVLKAKENISMEAGKAFTIKAMDDVSIESQSKNASMKASQGIKIDGMSVDATATGNMKLKANGQAGLEAATTDVKGSAMVNVQGGLIKLN